MNSKRSISIGALEIGGKSPVRVESMLKTPLNDFEEALLESRSLASEGCELLRVAFPTLELESPLRQLVASAPLPLMADIHFDPKLAIAAIEAGCPSIRINPGNMGPLEQLRSVVQAASERGVAIRIGANAGSLNKKQLDQTDGDVALALCEAVQEQLGLLERMGYEKVLLSAKSTSVPITVRANLLLAAKFDYPLHVGITEAGPGVQAIVKSTVGIALLLAQGVGDTLRISLTGTSVEEVRTAYFLLRSLELRHRGVEIISCPTCGRKKTDVAKLIQQILPFVEKMTEGFSVAVMGCEVNGPREAANADIGVAGSSTGLVLFKKGKVLLSGPTEEVFAHFCSLLLEMSQNQGGRDMDA